MSFALYKAKAFGLEPWGGKRRLQRFAFTITGTSSDVALDIGTLTAGALGTFWTAATGDSTYGTQATNVLALLQGFLNSTNCMAVGLVGGDILTKVRGTAAGSGVYTMSISNFAPVITLNSGEGFSTINVVWEVDLLGSIAPIYFDYN